MKGKQVPWWRKALNLALNGIRSGFGLFSRTQMQIIEMEPETYSGPREIREEEEAKLTKHSPESSHIADKAANSIKAAVTHDVAVVAVAELENHTEPGTEVQSEESSILMPNGSEAAISDVLGSLDDAARGECDAENEVALAAEEVRETIGVPEAVVEIPTQVADLKPEPAHPEDSKLEVPVQESPIEPTNGDSFEQVTEPQVTVENESVDEVAPQAESAVSEDSAPLSASPVPDEMVESGLHAAEESNIESVEVVASNAVGLNFEETLAQTIQRSEELPVEQSNILESISQQITDEVVEQVIEQPMELNHPNSEPAAEQEETAELASQAAAEDERASAPGQSAEEPAIDDKAVAPVAVTAGAQHASKPFIKLEAKEGEANASPFSVIVSQVYDGPLDLLLDLIRKQDIDIYDIPIARITAQFLTYVNQLKESDVDVAGEFIYTASLLIHIKSKMLLPRAPSGPDDAAEDPRRELVERLLEHERFKNAAQMLQQKQMLEAATWTNPGVREFKEDAGAEPEIAADTVDLVRVFREILDRARNRPILNVEEDSVTVGQMIQFLSRRLSMEDRPIALRRLLSHSRSERALIAMFLALLELVRLQAILLRQDLAFSEIFIKKHSNFESVMTDAVTHDDWK